MAPAHLSANLFINGNSVTYGGGLLLGARAYGGIGIDYSTYNDFDAESWVLSGNVGVRMSAATARTQICAVARFANVHGPSDVTVTDADYSEYDVSSGLHVGYQATRGAVQILPTASLQGVIAFPRFTTAASTVSDTKYFVLIGLGIGMVFNQQVSLKPSIAFPVGLRGGSTSFGVTATFNLSSNH